MIQRIVLLLAFFTLSTHFAQEADQQFSEANTLYKNGDYTKAIEIYEAIEATGNVSSELYYNLGNSYYKINKVGPSIFNYEKALQLDPLNEDAQNNLIFARRLSLDRIEELPKSVFQKFDENYLSKLSYNQWAIAAVILSFLASCLFLFYYFSHSPSLKRLFFTSSLIGAVLLIATLSITMTQYGKASKTIEAIIYTTEVSVKNEPTKNAEEAFVIHEGTKVSVLDKVDDWKKIKLVDGKIGWLKDNEIKLLHVF
ncbi:TPR_REGION domain-containing protein [Tenacibaculum sp. 190524A05c]|uniref:SH3 domain-containing protein n=1 Tax=Tenacibaculum platacis TaxID=3137852 RepID=UPI0031FB0055